MITKPHSVFSALVLGALSFNAYAGMFGYYHQTSDDLLTTRRHTNLVHVQAANTATVSLDDVARLHPSAKIVFEFNTFDISFYGQNGCKYGKCMSANAVRVAEIVAAVERAIMPHKSRLWALMIADEPETNPPTLAALEQLIDAIKANPTLSSIPLWVNFDNVQPFYTRAPFTLPDGIDIASLTPAYGRYCFSWICETARATVVMDAMATHNAQHPAESIKWVVVGDGWAEQADADERGNWTFTGYAHREKIDGLYQAESDLAHARGIEVAGELVFSHRYPGPHTVASAPEAIRDAWAAAGRKIMGQSENPVSAHPDPGSVDPSPIGGWIIPDFSRFKLND
jgi:hypothetical protein